MPKTKSIRPRGRSMPPRPPHEQERAARLLHALGSPEPEILDALLDGIDVDAVVTSAGVLSATELANLACIAEVEAYEFLQRCSREQKAKLRGCSPQLTALALEQSMALFRWGSELAVRKVAQERAGAKLALLGREATLHIEQARNVIRKVGDDAVRARLIELCQVSPLRPAQEIGILADVAESILRDAPPRMATRAILFGLDASLVEALRAFAAALCHTERVATTSLLDDASRQAMNRAHAATWLLATHLADAFAGGRRLDDGIPLLRGTEKLRPLPVRKSGTHALSLALQGPPSSRTVRTAPAPGEPAAIDQSSPRVLHLPNRS